MRCLMKNSNCVMKKFICLLSILFFLSCYQKECDCSLYKTGKFKFTQTINGKAHTTIFERTETYQTETYNGKTDTATVRWINNCEFIIQKKHPKNREEKKAISMKIISTNALGYDFEYAFVGDEKKQRGTVTKIN